jgi:hypothetical protein
MSEGLEGLEGSRTEYEGTRGKAKKYEEMSVKYIYHYNEILIEM